MTLPGLKKRTESLTRFAFTLTAFCLIVPLTAIADEPAGTSSLAKRLQQLKEKNGVGTDSFTVQPVANPVYKKVLKSIALLETGTDEDGMWTGTGWVVDAEQRLLVTNYHVIEGMLDCFVYFPEYIDGKLQTDSDQLDGDRALHATVIDSDETVDLALIQLDDALPDGIVALELAEQSATPGQKIHSVAGLAAGSDSLWVYSTGHVRQIAPGALANDYDTTLLESDMATNKGNSGGPVVDDKGRVVAVVEGQRTDARLVSIYVDLSVLVDYLSDAIRCVDPVTLEDIEFAGDRHYFDGRPSVAAKLANKALKIEPGSAKWLAYRAWCWWLLDDIDSARADFEDAIKSDSAFAEAHYGLGCLARDDKQFAGAIKHFTNAIRNDSESASYYCERANAYRHLTNYDKARRDIQAAFNQDPESVEATRILAFLEFDEGNYAESNKHLDEIIEEFKEDPETLGYGARLMIALKEFKAAAGLAAMALEQDPEFDEAYFYRGLALLKLEQYDDATDMLAAATSRLPNDSDVMFYFGLAMIRSGQEDAGLSIIANAHKLNPLDKDLEEAYLSLRKSINGPLESETQPVSTSTVPNKFLGTWKAQVTQPDVVITLHQTFRADGTYHTTVKIQPPGEQPITQQDSGTFRVNGDQVKQISSSVGKTKMRRFRWQGQHLAFYKEDIGGWILFARVK